MKKIVFCDIDGTLVKDNKDLITSNIDEVKEFVKNNEFILCSGRATKSSIEVSKKHGATPVVISSNGAVVYDYLNDNLIFENVIDKNVVQDIYHLCNDLKLKVYFNKALLRVGNNFQDKYPLIEGHDLEHINQIVIMDNTFIKMLDIKKEMEKIKGIKISNLSLALINEQDDESNYYYLDITKDDTSKGLGIKKYMEYKKDDAYLIAIGDHVNDLSMFEVCDYNIATDNAFYELKLKSDFLTTSNNDDAVEVALKHIKTL